MCHLKCKTQNAKRKTHYYNCFSNDGKNCFLKTFLLLFTLFTATRLPNVTKEKPFHFFRVRSQFFTFRSHSTAIHTNRNGFGFRLWLLYFWTFTSSSFSSFVTDLIFKKTFFFIVCVKFIILFYSILFFRCRLHCVNFLEYPIYSIHRKYHWMRQKT